jgi:hypothetical protein
VSESLFAVAFALRPSLLLSSLPEAEVVVALLVQWSPVSHLGFVIPQAFWCGGCSFPREGSQSPICNGTCLRARCNSFKY